MTAPDNDPVGNAWQIHAALTTWTANVDSKANFVITLDTGLLAGAVALRGSDNFLRDFRWWLPLWTWSGGLVLLGFAALLTAFVVAPRLNWTKLRNDTSKDYIFFGHLQKYALGSDRNALKNALENEPILPVLGRQLEIMGAIAWQKHRRLQLSIAVGTVGALLIGLSLAFNS